MSKNSSNNWGGGNEGREVRNGGGGRGSKGRGGQKRLEIPPSKRKNGNNSVQNFYRVKS